MSTSTSAIESVLVENRVFHPQPAVVAAARISGMDSYNAMCASAEADLEGFWAALARDNLVWTKPFTRTLDESKAPFYRWFDDGQINASANCLDPVPYTHLRAYETKAKLVCRPLLEKKNNQLHTHTPLHTHP